MKVKSKIFSIVVIAVVVILMIGFQADASLYIDDSAPSPIYTVENANEEFKISLGESAVTGDDLSEMISDIPDGAAIFFSAVESHSAIEIKGNKKILGSLYQSSAALILEGNIILDAEIFLFDCSITVKSGSVGVEGGCIEASGAPAFVLDRSADAKLTVNAGVISSDHVSGTINHKVGILNIGGGEISSSVSPAVTTSSSLHLSGAPKFSGVGADISTDRPIHLSADGSYFSGALRVRMERSFQRGEFVAVLLDAREDQAENISVLDKSGLAKNLKFYASSKYTEEKNVFAVFETHEAKFLIDGSLYSTVSFANGESITEPPNPERTGYIFKGWYRDSSYETKYSFGVAESESISLYASFALMPPRFEINSLSFVYDGNERKLSFSELYHPLGNIGSYSYLWYKNDDAVCSTSEVKITEVSDSGAYYCKLLFSYNGDFVTLTTPVLNVKVEKCSIKTPLINDLVYTGNEQKITAETSSLYSSEVVRATDVGEYSVTITLIDSDNYRWQECDGVQASVPVRITKAENEFCSPPRFYDIYEGQPPFYLANSLFGEVKPLFSPDGVNFDLSVPTKPGSYFVKFCVEETDNYFALSSEILTFSILAERCVGLRCEGNLDKSVYYAFEKVSLDGLLIIADYNSGRSERVASDEIFIEYKTGECLLVTDTCVIIRYAEASLPISISVLPIEYDVSGIIFSDGEAVYNGMRHTLSAEGSIVGKDGIALNYSIDGGGINAGKYTVTLAFSTSSINYLTPAPISASLTVLPMPIIAEYSSTEFVYDGKLKIPSATAIGASGAPFRLTMSGAACYAGEYIAEVVLTDANYTVINPSVTFVIRKAVIDLSCVHWSGSGFIYDGLMHSVTVDNLPKEVSLIGYTNASFTDAGSYIAVAKISYDSENYEEPEPLTFSWCIEKATYDTSGFEFIDKNVIYDGKVHYPDFVGAMPVGIDGIALKFSFSSGAKRVSDGSVAVTVSFSTDSSNYTVPESIVAYVTVSPMSIEVNWLNTEFVYDGDAHIPIATTPFCELQVRGEGINAGEYTAICESLNSDYRVTNPKMAFTVKKAENEWITEPYINDIYESGKPSPRALAKSGDVEFCYYADQALSEAAVMPLSAGVYYLVAFVSEGENYVELRSDPVAFCVIAVVPVSLEIEQIGDIVAYGSIGDFNIKVICVNNDGTRNEVLFKDVEVDYGTAEKLLSGDRNIVLRALGIECEVILKVDKARFDTSGVYWTSGSLVYNGEEQNVYLAGLPEGLCVEYICSGGKDAGEYLLEAKAVYDEENYYEPILPTSRLCISKKVIDIPTEEVFVYNGANKSPTFIGNEFCTATYPEMKNAGKYTVEYTLFDENNYTLSGEGKTLITVLPMPLTLVITDRDSFEISEGDLFEGDELIGEFYKERGYIHFRTDSPNYDIRIIPLKSGAKSGVIWIFVILTVILAVLFVGAWFYVKKREAEISPVQGIRRKTKNEIADFAIQDQTIPELTTIMAIDEAHANGLITDSLAKSLISEDSEVVYTSGYKKCIVNLNDLCAAFESGERIDINSMKKRGLIPSEARYVKVLGGGVIDKPLTVLANSFSLSSAKMIALTGGKAIKARTQRDRRAK